MEAEKYLLEQLKERELFNCNTDDCYQVLAEVLEDYAKLYSNAKLDELANASQEMIYDRQDTKPNPDGGLILRNFQVCYAIPKQSVIKAKDTGAQWMQEREKWISVAERLPNRQF